MLNPSEKKSPQRETQIEQTPASSQWNMPTLAELLERLSITTKPSQANNSAIRTSNE